MRHNVTCHCRLPEGAAAQQFDHERDIVAFDLVLVMDKFCAADVLREVGLAGPCMAQLRVIRTSLEGSLSVLKYCSMTTAR